MAEKEYIERDTAIKIVNTPNYNQHDMLFALKTIPATVIPAADAIEELQRICNAMKPKYDAVCAKCACYAEAEFNDNGFLICPASGMDITAWDYCSYFEKAVLPEEEPGCGERLEPPEGET